jgi:DNA polymerase-3 subunit epsilon
VLVAHNLRFDREFLASEFKHAGLELPSFPAMCTLSLGALVHSGGVSRRLADCCEQLGVELTDAHDALGDARAAAGVLTRYLSMAVDGGARTLDDVGCVPLEWPHPLPQIPESGRRHLRRGIDARGADGTSIYLAGLVKRLDASGLTDPNTAAYLDVLDRALEDRRLSAEETDELAAVASEWGMSEEAVNQAHATYVAGLFAAALADGVVTEAEWTDLDTVIRLIRTDTRLA